MIKKVIYRQMRSYKRMAGLWAFSAVCLATILLAVVACQKNGEMIETPLVTEASIKIVSARQNPLFGVFIDDKQLGDGITSGFTVRRMVEKTDGSQHFVVKELVSNTIIVDTMLVLARPSCSLSVLESDTTAPSLIFIGGESDISEDSAKLAFFVGDPAIPAPIDIYLYKSNLSTNSLDTVPVHIFRNVSNFSTTDFLTIDLSSEFVGYSILVRNSATNQLVPGIINNTGVVWNNPYSGIRIRELCGVVGSGEKTNIHNIMRLIKPADFYDVNCMIFF